jgi:hypothetical protein
MEVRKKYRILFIVLSIVSLGTIATLSTLLALKSCSTNHVETTVLRYTSHFDEITTQSLPPLVLLPPENELVLEEGAGTTKEYTCTPLNTEEVDNYLQNHKVDVKFDQQNMQPTITNNRYEMTSTFIKNNFTPQFLINTFVNGLISMDYYGHEGNFLNLSILEENTDLQTEIVIVKENENNFSVTKSIDDFVQEKISIIKNNSNTEYFSTFEVFSPRFVPFDAFSRSFSRAWEQKNIINNDKTNLHILIGEKGEKYIDPKFLFSLEDEFHESASHGYNFVISPCD